MNVNDIKTLIELQALQSINTNNTTSNSGSSLFQNMLQEVLSSESSLNSNKMQSIGSLWENPSSNPSPLLSAGLNGIQANDASSLFSQTHNTTNSTETNTHPHPKTNFDDIISKAASIFNIPENLIKSVIKQESNYNPNAQSYAGAGGLMQLMPATARSLGVKNIFDPTENIMGGSKYLSQMLSRYDGDIKKAVAAYNAGPGNVDKYGGIPPFKETINYVHKIMNTYLG